MTPGKPVSNAKGQDAFVGEADPGVKDGAGGDMKSSVTKSAKEEAASFNLLESSSEV